MGRYLLPNCQAFLEIGMRRGIIALRKRHSSQRGKSFADSGLMVQCLFDLQTLFVLLKRSSIVPCGEIGVAEGEKGPGYALWIAHHPHERQAFLRACARRGKIPLKL